jgi:hypothetical protein
MRERYASLSGWIAPVFEREETVKLRCVETNPRHLSGSPRELGPGTPLKRAASTVVLRLVEAA